MSVREVRKNGDGGQYQFNVIIGKKKSRLITRFVDSDNESNEEDINFEIANFRLIQLANDVLNAFNRKAEFEKFEPTIQDFEQKLGTQFDVECYVIDLIRIPSQKKTAQKIYEWLKSNEDWLYNRDSPQ